MTRVVVVDSGETKPKRFQWWLWFLLPLVILSVAIGGFVLWALSSNDAMPEAIAALESDEHITVTTRAWIAFLPNDVPPTMGLILYPGGRVPAEAYAPLARSIAAEGYLVVIVYPPLNLAIFNPNVAESVTQYFSAIEQWVIGGHSLGGTAAAIFADSHQNQVDGIIFLASYPSGNALVNSDLAVLSIYATNDSIASIGKIEASTAILPVHTRFVEIIGGNHAQFGYYGIQDGDGEASISREEQIRQTVEAILEFLRSINP
jgi:pimeloyl-ACP methyl ester carboxylesterase